LTNSTYCTSCNNASLRILTGNKCPCIDGYADVSGTCLPCIYSCITCIGVAANQCLTCNLTERIASSGSTPKSCDCALGTYDDGMNIRCKPCHI
jgi:hypothetical protein